MVSTVPTTKLRPVGPILQGVWYLGCILTLGYAPKYLERIKGWQVYDPSIHDEQYKAYSIHIDTNRLGVLPSKLAKQQKEWDRLMVPLSIITATSVVALAIPSPLNSHWLSAALYTAAFGLSLEGLLLTTYLSVFESTSSAETIGRLANGKSYLKGAVVTLAIATALPTALATYAALFLLGGLIVMTGTVASGNNLEAHKIAFRAIVLFPVSTMLVCLVVAVIGCEVFIWMERKYAQIGNAEESEPEGLPFSISVGKAPDRQC